MTALKMLFNVFWGEPDGAVNLCRFSNLLRRKKIMKKAADFYHCNQFFLLVVDAFWLALMATECGCQTWDELETYMKTENWHAMIDQVASAYINPHAVQQKNGILEKNVCRQARVDINNLRAVHENSVAAGRGTKRLASYWTTKEAKLVADWLAEQKDVIRDNALLFLNNGLLYREFNNAC